MADWIGQQLGNYRLVRLLGEGGFAEVYLGEHIHLGTRAAIKLLHTQLVSDEVEKFRIEARTIAHLVHPNIVRVLDFGVEGKTPFLVMDFASNGTLRQRHGRGAPVPLTTIILYTKQIASALQYAHEQKLIHRDIKPENMLVGGRNEVLLSDFGIALVAQSSRYQSTQDVIGTVAYMSPEQIQGKPRPASDQYSLGIVVYEWLSGDRPFHGSFTELCAQHMYAVPPSLQSKVPAISRDVEQVVMKTLAKDPHDRFVNILEFADALEKVNPLIQSTIVVPISSSPPPLPPTLPVVVRQPPKTEAQSYISPPMRERETGPQVLDTVAIPEERGLEMHGIERVSPTTRTHVRIFDNFTMWFGANLVISTIALGTLANFAFGLGFWDSVASIVIFNALGVLPVAFFSTLGPKLGLRQMTITRFSFGWVGGIIMAFFNVAACIAWSAVNVIVGSQLVVSLSNGAIPLWAGIIVIAALTTLVSIYGYRYVHRYERWAWIPMAIMFLIMFIVGAPHFSMTATPAFGLAEVASFITFGGAVYGFATGWSSYAADYNVNQPENTRTSRVFWLTFLGVFIPCVLLETLGMAFTSGIANVPAWKTGFGTTGDVGGLLSAVVSPLGGFGKLLLVLLALSIIANNIPNDYSLGLSVQVFGKAFQKVKRYVWTLIGAVIYIVIAIIGSQNFAATLQSFLLDVGYWLGGYAIILVLEHFVFRRGRYNVDDWNTPSRLPLGWAAIVAIIAGLVGGLLGADQLNFQGFITRHINQPYGIDLGFELSVVLAGIVYLILRRIEINSSPRGEVGAGGK